MRPDLSPTRPKVSRSRSWQRFRMDLCRSGVRKAVAISALVHALAAAWVAVVYWLWPVELPTAEPPPAVAIEVVRVEPPPPAAAGLADEGPVDPMPTPQIAATAPTGRRETAAPNTATAPGVVQGPSLLAMRTPGESNGRAVDLRLRLPADFDAGGPPPPEVEATGRLAPHGGGRYRSNEGVFSADVAADGSVKIKDHRNLNVHLALPRPKQIGRGIADWYESDKGPYGADGKQTLEKQVSGSVDKEDRSKTAVVPVLGGGFDITDKLMRRHGQDPYAARKLAYLDATRDERVEIGNRHRAEQLAQVAKLMQKNLDRMWASVPALADRKAALFEMWDECAETGEPAVVEAGAAARKLVVGFIRARLPAGSANAYTAAELAGYNQKRHSTQEFAPYTD